MPKGLKPKPPSYFWSKVDEKSDSECWIWQGSIDDKGYGKLSFQGKFWFAHRLAFFLTYGELPPCVCHTCDNPPCVNPKHLFGGTLKDNSQDMVRKGRKYVRPGETNHQSKLKTADVLEIRKMHKILGRQVLAKNYNVTPLTIDGIIARRRWKHI